MKSDLDRLMAERNLDAFLVLGDSHGNTIMNYLTGGASLERALLFKRRDEPTTLIHGGMERDNAAATGLRLLNRDQLYDAMAYLQKVDGDRLAAQVAYLTDVIEGNQLKGRIGVYGMFDAGAAMAVLNQVQDRLTGSELVGEFGDTLFSLARETKDNWEIAQMREAGRLDGHRRGRDAGVHPEPPDAGRPGRQGGRRAADDRRGARLYAQPGVCPWHVAGPPHLCPGARCGRAAQHGTPEMPLRLGQSIVFDIFPKTASGYYHDMTRTWCLGYAPDEVAEAYGQAKEIFDQAVAALAVGKPCRDFQAMTLDYFESKGHPTMRTHPGGLDGYVHSLGHGLGLDIHEAPSLGVAAGNTRTLQPGHVVSVEPGLYYPERGFGVRVEDTVAFEEDGTLVTLTQYPYDLVIPMK